MLPITKFPLLYLIFDNALSEVSIIFLSSFFSAKDPNISNPI